MYFNFISYIIGAYKLQHQNAAVRIIIYNTVKSLGSNSANLVNYKQFAPIFTISIALPMAACLPVYPLVLLGLLGLSLIAHNIIVKHIVIVSDHIFSSSIAM